MRALLIVLDSVGLGDAPDAAEYGDEGANTLGHIFEQTPDLDLPNLCALGLGEILAAAGARCHAAPAPLKHRQYLASYGRMEEKSAGKDTTTGHWELAGAILDQAFATFQRFPDELVHAIEHEAGVRFIGNYPRSGTTILEELGEEHTRSGNPILYTSADSVLQIAAHEDVVPVERLYGICEIARRHCDRFRIGRVIARPFDGAPGNFRRTANRHDYSMKPPPTVLNAISDSGLPVIGVGKINDIFAGQGITESHPTSSNRDGMQKIDELWERTERGLIFANLVDFDMMFGHRRDVAGYAQALREFDDWLGKFLLSTRRLDLAIITADHGNDPTYHGSDHTREQVPLFVVYDAQFRNLGLRSTFSDVAASLAHYFDLEPWAAGKSFLQKSSA